MERKDIEIIQERNGEIIIRCPFNDCDADSKGREAHCYVHSQTGQYECKKCGEKGNLITLARFLGDDIKDIAINNAISTSSKQSKQQAKPKPKPIDPQVVEQYHLALPPDVRRYLNERGISDSIIDEHKLGWGNFRGSWWIVIPIPDAEGKYAYLKLRRAPGDARKPKMLFEPEGAEASIYGVDMLKNGGEMIVICEGEFDRLAALAKGIPAVTGTAGAGTFKEEWPSLFSGFQKVYVAYDKDDDGQKNADNKVIPRLAEATAAAIYKITFPARMTEGKDVTDYFTRYGGTPDEFISQLAKQVAGIDVSQFQPMTADELADVLGLTIKKDDTNKLVTFLCELSAYTDNAQFNISFNAPSSTGKSYIPTEIAKLFPQADVMELGYCSPTAFFHDVGKYEEKETDKGKEWRIIADLSRKIIIFLDQPHNQLLEHLRPLLSHDKKELTVKITDKQERKGLRTKTVVLLGFPSVIFCTAGLSIDEQEATRFLLLSPEVNSEKIRQGIHEAIRKEVDNNAYQSWLEENPKRKLLKDRIKAIRHANIAEVKIKGEEEIERRFLERVKILKPRHQRDIKRLMSLVKSFALLNLWWRKREVSVITADHSDIEEAFKVWEVISASQELNIPPYIHSLYQEVIMALWEPRLKASPTPLGLSRQEVLKKHYKVYGRMLDATQFRQQIIPMLETAGLIIQEIDPGNKRIKLIYPITPDSDQYSESEGGVTQPHSEEGGGVPTGEQQHPLNFT